MYKLFVEQSVCFRMYIWCNNMRKPTYGRSCATVEMVDVVLWIRDTQVAMIGKLKRKVLLHTFMNDGIVQNIL